MTDEQVFLQRLFDLFESAGIAYMLTGSVAAGIHGDARVHWQDLGVPYVRRWADDLGIGSLLERLLIEAQIVGETATDD